MRLIIHIIACLLVLVACKKENADQNKPATPGKTIIQQLNTNYQQLPEKAVSQSKNGRVYAQYATPTKKYLHGILGDDIEAEQLVVVADSMFFEYQLPGEYVFEDIRPRLYDVDADGSLEFITIRSHVSKGAGIAIYKLIGGQLREFAALPEIGTPNRWLNIVTINDLDKDGIVEMAWIETPHIGGILKAAKILPGVLNVISQVSQFSNHEIGSRNLCLSVLQEYQNHRVVYVPNQSRTKIAGFRISNNQWTIVEEINQTVDFSKKLASQYPFNNIIEEENNCIDIK